VRVLVLGAEFAIMGHGRSPRVCAESCQGECDGAVIMSWISRCSILETLTRIFKPETIALAALPLSTVRIEVMFASYVCKRDLGIW
jgi:hypothetical protein